MHTKLVQVSGVLWISLFTNKTKQKMNVKHIFVFKICIVLLNGMYSTDYD